MTEEQILKEAWTRVTTRPFTFEEKVHNITISLGLFYSIVHDAMRAARKEALRGN